MNADNFHIWCIARGLVWPAGPWRGEVCAPAVGKLLGFRPRTIAAILVGRRGVSPRLKLAMELADKAARDEYMLD